MIKTVAFTKDANCIAAKSCIDFRPGVNLVVGDQGCGKSTLLSQIDYYSKSRRDPTKHRIERDKCKIGIEWSGGEKRYGYFDFEKHNPRTQPGFEMGYGYDTGFQLQAMWSSHGETVKPLLFDVLKGAKDAVVVLDEPDMALSPRSIHRLVSELKRLDSEGSVQIIISAHNPHLIASFENVVSLEHGRWIKSSEFLELQYTTDAPVYNRNETRKILALLDT